MKKVFSIAAAALLITNVLFAEDGDDRKVRFGLKVTPTPTWMRSNDTKLVENSGMKFGFGFGLQIEFKINSTAAFVTGIGGDFLGGKQIYKNGQGYMINTGDNGYRESGTITYQYLPGVMHANSMVDDYKFYELKSREIKVTYITLPILLKLMTKDISGFKYFGVFGANVAVATKYKVTDEITELNYTAGGFSSGGSSTLSDMTPSGDYLPFNAGLNVGLGMEYNLSGSTSAFISFNYCRGFINQYKSESKVIVDNLKESLNNMKTPVKSKQSAFSDGVQINIGMLF